MMSPSSWLVRQVQPQARLRLFCFPYAGGGAQAYADWQRALGPEIEVCAVQLPGRGRRMAELPLTSLDTLLAQLAQALHGMDQLPYAFFGHSLGSLVAFELARLFRRHGVALPRQLIVSGGAAPRCRETAHPIHGLPDAEFIAALRAYEGSPPEVLDNAELMELLLPMIRADFTIGERYRYRPSLRLPVPICVLNGRADSHVSEAAAQAWAEETSLACQQHRFDGGHFFIHTQQAAVLESVAATLLDIQALA